MEHVPGVFFKSKSDLMIKSVCQIADKRKSLPLAKNSGDNGCSSNDKCEKGEGDCDSDRECKTGLKCFQRENGEQVPGVIIPSGFPKDTDVCYDPQD